jgi:uncharacterized membrane protein
MAADPRDAERLMGEFEKRLSRIEQRLGMPAEPVVPVVAPEIVAPKQATPSASVEASHHEPMAPPLNATPRLPPIPVVHPAVAPPVRPATSTPNDAASRLEELARKRAAAMAAREEQPLPPPVLTRTTANPMSSLPQIPAPARAAMKRMEESLSLEKMVGGRLAAYIGAIFLVIGLVLGVTYGIKQGWFRFPPEFRCAAVALCGVGLIGGGQFVRRKLGAAGNAASAGLAAAGIGAMYGAALAAWGMYDLYPAAVAFTLLAVISAAGVGLGLWWGSLPLGILALIGAYLNPIWLHNEHSHPVVLPVYLIALLVMGLTLSAWRPDPFRWLRTVAWWGTVLLGSAWVGESGLEHPFVGMAFLAVVWGLVHAELIVGSARVPAGAAVGSSSKKLSVRLARPLRVSFATTVWTVGAGILTASFEKANVHIEQWHVAAAGFAGTLALALVLAGHLRAFKDRPRTDRERLGVALWAEAGALLITTVALGVSDWFQVAAWLAMGVAAIAAGRWARARSLDAYGLVVLCIAVGRLLVYESWQWLSAGHTVAGVVFTWWSLLMAIGGAAWLGAAWLMHRPSEGAETPSPKRGIVVSLAIAVGISLVFAGCMFQGAEWEMVAALGGAWALTALGAAWMRDSVVLRIQGVVVLAVTSAATALVQLVLMNTTLRTENYSHWHASVGGLVVTSWSLVLLWLGAIWGAASWGVRARTVRAGEVVNWSVSIAMVAIGIGLTLLACVTKGTSEGALCVAWTCVGVLLVGAHSWRRMLAMDVMGLVTFGLASFVWCGAYVLDHPWLEEIYPAFSHPGLWVALGIVAAMLGAAIWLRGGKPRRATCEPAVVAAFVVGGTLLLGSTSLEVSRSAGILLPTDPHAQAAALTVWWGVFSAVMLTIGFVLGVPIVRHLGLGLLGLASVKAVIWDLAGVELGWRVVSFLGLGVLMMAVAIAYAKLSSRLDKQEKTRAGTRDAAEPIAGKEWFPGG